MNLQELKNIISTIESADRNIANWDSLKDRELVIIPTDTEYYEKFKAWAEDAGIYYDGAKEKSPMCITRKNSTQVLDVLIQNQEDFAKPHKDRLAALLSSTPTE